MADQPSQTVSADHFSVALASSATDESRERRGPIRTEILEQLAQGVQALTDSEQWQRWLTFCGRFRRYSFHNQVLILSQRPEATWVAGYRTWQGLGRQVRRGERGIAILAPCRPPARWDQADQAEVPDLPVQSFRVVRVFDLDQTEGRALPRPVREIDDGARHSELNQLLVRAADLGFSVEFWELRGERHGDCSHALRRIRIDRRLASAQMTKTLCHELAHAVLHGADFQGSRALAELEAESVAYVCCHDLGIDSSEYSFGYLAGWAGGGPEAARAISAAGSRISGTAVEILEGIAGSPRHLEGDTR